MLKPVVNGLFWRKTEVRRGGSKDLKHGTNKEIYPPLAGWTKRLWGMGSSIVSYKYVTK
jgi:hypothetical protein